jgi:acetyltransferase EpsM
LHKTVSSVIEFQERFMANNQSKSKKEKVLIWGASGHAMVVADILRLSANFELVGFLDDVHKDRKGQAFFGSTILGGADQLEKLHKQGIRSILLGFGDCNARLRLSEDVRARGFTLATAIHPQAIVARDALIGAGSVVCAGAVVNPGCRVGENVILNTGSSVNHECVIEDGVHIGPGVHLGGRVHVGRTAWIGIGATVKDRVVIGARTIIGCGSLVLKDVPQDYVAYGHPAKVVRKVKPDDLKI